MGGLPVAFSLHKTLSSLGTDLGAAALIGLAILVALMFAQARETAALRRRAQELSERVSDLEARLGRSTDVASGGDRSGTSPPAAPPPAWVRRPEASRAVAAGSNGSPAWGGAAGGLAWRLSRRRRLGFAGLSAVAIAVGVAVALVLANSSAPTSHAAGSRLAASHAGARRMSTRIEPAGVPVTVLNGTPTAGLAHRAAQRLRSARFPVGKVTNAADQTATATRVAYLPERRADALAVARVLRLPATAVGPIDAGTRAVACGGATTCTTAVVVTVGQDLASR
jgi:hypothetical protein